jgi:L-ribulose-5-phosphate 3-epimerase
MATRLSRREFIQVSSAAAWTCAVPFLAGAAALPPAREPFRGTFCLFSKAVPQLTWQELGQKAKHAGFGGIDLTVRDEGHVLPQRAAEDLPKAVGAIRAAGLEVPMITTELTSAEDPAARPILSTAAKLHIPYFKPGYYHYQFVDVRKELEEAGRQFRGLAHLAEQEGIAVGFHNHSGNLGAPIWDISRVMDTLSPKWAGFYFDLEHATIEGGLAGWKIAANLVMPRMKMMAIKDYYWEKSNTGEWRTRNCHLGEGMCHYREFLKMAAQGGFHGPISLHLEYQTPGVSDEEGRALSRAKDDEVMASAQGDLDNLKSLVQEAYEGV